MTVAEIWQQLEQQALAKHSFFGRPLVTVTWPAFELYAEHFAVSYNPLNQRENYRTREFFTHIHAVRVGEYVEFHRDFFNPTRSWLLALPHFFVSVIPYFVSLWWQGKKPYTIYLDE